MTMCFLAARSSQKPTGEMVEGDVLWQRICGYTTDLAFANVILRKLTAAHEKLKENPEDSEAYGVMRKYDRHYDSYTRFYELVSMDDYDK